MSLGLQVRELSLLRVGCLSDPNQFELLSLQFEGGIVAWNAVIHFHLDRLLLELMIFSDLPEIGLSLLARSHGVCVNLSG